MLYLFGQLALSDSLFYHEIFDAGDHSTSVATTCPEKAAASAHTLAARQQRQCHLSQANRAATGQQEQPTPSAGLRLS